MWNDQRILGVVRTSLLEVVFFAFFYVGDGRSNVTAAMDGFLFGEMRKHLNAEAAVEIVGDAFLPWASDDLGGESAGDAWLGHDVVGQFPGARKKLIARNDFIHEAVFQSFFGVDGLSGEESIGAALYTQEFQHAAVNAVAGHGTDVVVKIENDGVFAADGDIAHQANFGVKARPVQNADGGNFEVVHQRTDVDAAVFVGVFVGPVIQIFLFQLKTFGIGIHHEIFAGAAENHDFVFGIGTDGLEQLPDGAVIFHAELYGTTEGVGFGEKHAICPAMQFVMLLEALLIFLKPWRWNEINKRHGQFSFSFLGARPLERASISDGGRSRIAYASAMMQFRIARKGDTRASRERLRGDSKASPASLST